jgi:hypothetical protein
VRERVSAKGQLGLLCLGWSLLLASGIGAIFAGYWTAAVIALGVFAFTFIRFAVGSVRAWRFVKSFTKPS